jgi:hypothetical protein
LIINCCFSAKNLFLFVDSFILSLNFKIKTRNYEAKWENENSKV